MSDERVFEVTATVAGDTRGFYDQLFAALARPEVEDWDLRARDVMEDDDEGNDA